MLLLCLVGCSRSNGIETVDEANAAEENARFLSGPAFDHISNNVPLTDLDKRNLRKAADIYEQLRKFNPEQWGAFFALGQVYGALEDYSQAEENLRQVLILTKGDPKMKTTRGESHNLLARGLLIQTKYKEALDEIEAALKELPDTSGYLFVRAQCYTQLDRVKEAKRDLIRVLQLEPSHPQARGLLRILNRPPDP